MATYGVGLSSTGLRPQTLSRTKLLEALSWGCFVFAAQAVNAPISSFSSAHLVGGVLLAGILGPALGAWTMAIVLTLQVLLLGDGGWLALGANIINMALLPAVAVQGLALLSPRGQKSASPLAMGILSAVAVPLAALLICGEVALFRSPAQLLGWQAFVTPMLGYHCLVGLLEAAITVGCVVLARPADLPVRGLRSAWAPWALAALLLCLAPVASSLPDIYEAASAAAGHREWLAP